MSQNGGGLLSKARDAEEIYEDDHRISLEARRKKRSETL